MITERLQRGFLWLARAANIEKSPTELLSDIRPTIDMDQRGWGHSDTIIAPFGWTLAGGAAGTFDLLTGSTTAVAPTPDKALVVLSLSVWLTGTGGTSGDVFVQIRPSTSGVASVVSRATVPYDQTLGGGVSFPSARAGSRQLLPAGHAWVPVGYRPELRIFFGVGGSQVLNVQGVVATVAAGFAAGAP